MLYNYHTTTPHIIVQYTASSVTNVTDFLLPIFTGGQDTIKSLININLSYLANKTLVLV